MNNKLEAYRLIDKHIYKYNLFAGRNILNLPTKIINDMQELEASSLEDNSKSILFYLKKIKTEIENITFDFNLEVQLNELIKEAENGQ